MSRLPSRFARGGLLLYTTDMPFDFTNPFILGALTAIAAVWFGQWLFLGRGRPFDPKYHLVGVFTTAGTFMQTLVTIPTLTPEQPWLTLFWQGVSAAGGWWLGVLMLQKKWEQTQEVPLEAGPLVAAVKEAAAAQNISAEATEQLANVVKDKAQAIEAKL